MDSQLGKRRYQANPHHVSADGHVRNELAEVESAAAAQYVSEQLNAPFVPKAYCWDGIPTNNDLQLKIQYGDTVYTGKQATVHITHLGMLGPDRPRTKGNLIVNPYQKDRWCPFYIVVLGCTSLGFEMLGWTTHERLIAEPTQDFGYGEKFAMSIDDLRPIEDLVEHLVS